MDPATRAPNVVPKGSIRLSEAFERLCTRLDPEWPDLPDLCGRWDDWIAQGEEVDFAEDPYRRLFEIEYRAERLLRSALFAGELTALIHNLDTGVDLELHRSEWIRTGEHVGIHSDYTDDRTPGPDCRLKGVAHPIFLSKQVFENWLERGRQDLVAAEANAGHIFDRSPDTRAFSIEEVIERTGLSRTTIYEEVGQKHLVARKCRNRTIVLESDLHRFLQSLPIL